jgi:hypothetical protein
VTVLLLLLLLILPINGEESFMECGIRWDLFCVETMRQVEEEEKDNDGAVTVLNIL